MKQTFFSKVVVAVSFRQGKLSFFALLRGEFEGNQWTDKSARFIFIMNLNIYFRKS